MLRADRLFRTVMSLNSDSHFFRVQYKFAHSRTNLPENVHSRLKNHQAPARAISSQSKQTPQEIVSQYLSVLRLSIISLFSVLSSVFSFSLNRLRAVLAPLNLFSAVSLCELFIEKISSPHVKKRALRVKKFPICLGQHS